MGERQFVTQSGRTERAEAGSALARDVSRFVEGWGAHAPSGVHRFAIRIKGSTVSCASDGPGAAANEARSDGSPCPEGVAS